MGRRSGTDITFGDMANRTVTLDQAWAEVAFVPAQSYESKASAPLRYVGLGFSRLRGCSLPMAVIAKRGSQSSVAPEKIED